MTAQWRRTTTRIGGGAAALLWAVVGCQPTTQQASDAPLPTTQASTAPAHKPLIALPSWLGGSHPTTATTASTEAAAVPTTPPPAMPMPDVPAVQPVLTTTTAPTSAPTAVATTAPTTMATTTSATTTFVEQPTSAGIAVATMPTTVPAVATPSPTTALSVAPMTVVNPATRPVASAAVAVASTQTPPPRAVAAATADPNAGVVAHKPFIAVSRWFGRTPAEGGGGGQPSILLLQHARSDSPVPLSDYAKQPTHALSAFGLRASLSAAELSRRLGPPAQLADYASPWYVYRLSSGRELWLHFAQPDEQTLLAADVIAAAEDGYTRNRVFSLLGMP